MTERSKPTRGPVTVCHTLVSNEVRAFSITAAPHGSCDPICASDFRSERSSSEIEANALLIKEAFDTATETGLTPQQLREQRDRFLTILKTVHEQFECPARNTNRGRAYREGVTISNDLREEVRAAIASVEAAS